MLNNLCLKLSENKNLLMLFSAFIYVLSLISVLTESILIVSFLFLLIMILGVIKKSFPIKYIIVWIFLFYIGIFNTSFRLKNVDELLSLAPVNSEIEGTIVSIPQGFTEGKPKFFFKVDKINFDSISKDFKDEKVLVTINSNLTKDELKIYSSARMQGRLSTPFKAGNPSQFDYANYLRNYSAYAVFYANTFENIEKELSLKAKVLQRINDYREEVIQIHSKFLPSPNLEILGGIVFGDDAVSPPQNIKKSFANSGLLHILAASGMNVAFIYTFFFWISSKLRLNYKFKVILGMIMVLIYSLMTGLGASIIRATFMLVFVLIGKLIDRDAHSISLLSFVALLMLLYNPLFINDVGFQLSFIVTLGILIMTPAIVRFNNKIVDYIVGAVAISIIAQLWVIPVQIFYFSNMSLYSVFANIMSVPILAVLSFGGFISSLLCVIKPVAEFVCKTFDFVLNPLLSLLINISDFWGHLPSSSITTTHPSIFQLLIYYAFLLCIIGFLYKEFREKYFKKLVIASLIFLFVWIVTIVPIKNKNLEIITFDVGNADSFLIKTPNSEYIMIDTGRIGYKGGKSQAEIIMLKYMRDKGIKDLEALIVTHFDIDHCGGASDVLKQLNVKKVYVNDLKHESNSAKSIYETAKYRNTDIILAENKQVVYKNKNFIMTNLLGESSDNDNENSIITLLEYGNFKMLFTGDASSSGILNVLNSIPPNITVLKVPHHGAIDGLNRDLIGYLNPNYAIISVGENKFGHPALYTLALLNNSKILRTDVDNSILIKINNENLKIYSYDSRRKKYRQR